ncbi:MAG: cation transporter [Lachnospiraceae bacterium]|nr:cation transporter [Lachnospiraceae bacterium]
MVGLLARFFIKETKDTTSPEIRQAYGVLCGSVGIFFNVLLALGKFVAGLLSGSIAIMADAANNLSDAGSSLIVLFGFKLAGQKPDPDHPFGHGRVEYISGLLVSMLIIYMAVELLKSSIDAILHPGNISFEPVILVILLVSILVKFYMFWYNRSYGKKIRSEAMLATSMDSLSDMGATAVVLISMLISHYTSLQIDGICGVLVALLIFYAGFNSAKETINPLLGQPPEPEFVQHIEEIVLEEEAIIGIHDLIVHNYGPGRVMISLHAEVPADGDILALHDVIDNVEHRLKNELHCAAVIHMDPVSTKDEKTLELKRVVTEIVKEVSPVLSIHDFRVVAGPTHTNLIFDMVVPYDFPLSDVDVADKVQNKIWKYNPVYFAVIEIDKAYTKGQSTK